MRTFPSMGLRVLAAAMLLVSLGRAGAADEGGWRTLGADDNFGVWQQPTGDWHEAGDAMLDPNENRRLIGKPGTGLLINGSRTNSLVTKQTFQDVEVHLEFMVAKGANSGVIFHGNHEIQILDSAHVKKPTGGHCGGVYPRAEAQPTYHHIDEGSPPRVNAAKPPGQWQTLDIIFQAARFDEAGSKTAHAKFVRVVHNGLVIQENVEVPYAHGPNWDRKQFPRGPIIFQGDYGLVAFRNIRVRPWNGKTDILNLPPEGFTALFNGKDFTGWRVHPKVKEMWSIEDGVLKSHGLLEQWGADLVTEKEYRDYVLMADFRMPAKSDSGIHFRNLAPAMIGKFGDAEQFNIRSQGGMGQLESFHFLPENMKLTEDQLPQVRYIDPEIGVWHTVKLTVVGKNLTAEFNGEVILDRFEYPEGILSTEPNAIRFQKHRFTEGDKPGERNPCPIEYRNIFIKELGPDEVDEQARPRASASEGEKPVGSPLARLLARIDRNDLPEGYEPAEHQQYVDRRMEALSPEQKARIGQLWKEKEKIDPNMPNRGASFVRILEYVADGETPPAETGNQELGPRTDVSPVPVSKPVNRWKWSAETDEEGATRKAIPIKIAEGQTIFVVPFGVSEDEKPPVVLLPESRFRARGRIATAHPVYLGITINHPNGNFAGRFQAVCPADEFRGGEDFEFTLELRVFQLDPSLAEMKDKLPSAPFHFVVQAAWFHTLDKQAGLEIAELELLPPADNGKVPQVGKVNLPPPAKAQHNNWPQFRGPSGDGVCNTAGPPLTWSETENIAWKTPVHDRGRWRRIAGHSKCLVLLLD